MADLCHGEVIYFSLDPESSVINSHRQQGTNPTGRKRAIIIRDGKIMLVNGPEEIQLARLAELQPGTDNHSTETAHLLAAIGAAWALGITLDFMRTGIKAFTSSQKNHQTKHPYFS